MISIFPFSFTLALLMDADLQLHAAKTFVSIPDNFSSSLIHVGNVSLPTGLCGFHTKLIALYVIIDERFSSF